jgi:hypothetical protein
MNKSKKLESLQDELFKNLPDAELTGVAGGIIISSVKNGGGVTNFGKIHDEEFDD